MPDRCTIEIENERESELPDGTTDGSEGSTENNDSKILQRMLIALELSSC